MTDIARKSQEKSNNKDMVCLGVIIGARGLKGDLRIKSFTGTPKSVAAYGPVDTDEGKTLTLKVTGEAKGVVIARAEGVADRPQAEALKGQRLYVPRQALPKMDDEDEYYHADLIGLDVVDKTEKVCGKVIALYDFGAGDLIDIRRPDGRTLLLPFSACMVSEVDISGGQVVVNAEALAQLEASISKDTEQ